MTNDKRPPVERSTTARKQPATTKNFPVENQRPLSKKSVQLPDEQTGDKHSQDTAEIKHHLQTAKLGAGAGAGESLFTGTDGSSTGDDRISRDERNLATYPIALLSYQARRDKTISQTRERRHPLTKKLITSTWEVLGSEKWGLPTPTDDAVVLVLLEISREMGFPQEVYFTQRDILNRLGWPDNRDHYRKLETVFNRLNAITIQSKNVFWDSTARAFVNTGFHLLESFEIISKPGRHKRADQQLPLSRFVWGEVLWKSFREGNLKPISLSFYFGLNLPIARRLFRFLDLVRYDGKPKYRIGLRKLCEEYLCLSEAKYPSTYKHTLASGHEELIRTGYLVSVAYETAKTGGENVVYEFGSLPSTALQAPGSQDGNEDLRLNLSPEKSQNTASANRVDNASSTLDSMPNALDIALSLEANDSERRRMASEAVFATLTELEQQNLHKRAVGALAPFLRDNMHTAGARLALGREISHIIEFEHAEAVTNWLQEQITTQQKSEQPHSAADVKQINES